MTTSIDTSKPLPGNASVRIPFPEPGDWMEEGNSRDLGDFKDGLCSGHFYKTIDNKLYVFLEVMTWKNVCIKEYMPLRVPAAGADASTLRIHHRDKGVRLQQDDYPAIEAAWQPLP